jgi:hypothetical protein
MIEELLPCFVLLALCCLIALTLPMSRIYDWEMALFRKCRWNNFAAGWEKRKSWWLPMARTIVGTLGIICLLIPLICILWPHIFYVLSGDIFHSTFDRHSAWGGVPAIRASFFLFTLFTVVSLPYVAIVRWKTNRNSPSGYWLFLVAATALCLCLLAPLTCAIGKLVTYIQAMGFTARRIYGLLYGLGGYIVILGFLCWAAWMPGKKNAQPTSEVDALKNAVQL